MSKSKRLRAAPIRDEEDEGYIPRHSRVAPARQLCSGSNKELVDWPRDDRCPVCEKKVTLIVVPGQRRVRDFNFGGPTDLKDARVVSEVYIVPSHMMRRR